MTQAHEVRLVAYCEALSRAGWIGLKDLPLSVCLMPAKPTYRNAFQALRDDGVDRGPP